MDQTVDKDFQTLSSTKLFKAHDVNEPTIKRNKSIQKAETQMEKHKNNGFLSFFGA